jgi:hypothetical protein
VEHKGYHCEACGGHRLHTFRIHESRDGKVTRQRVCSVCRTCTDLSSTEQSGLACPRCSNIVIRTFKTRPAFKTRKVLVPGTNCHTWVSVPVVRRQRRCRHCRHRWPTLELDEAAFC